VTLGTDGFGRSDTLESLRRFFEVDSVSIADAALSSLASEGKLEHARVEELRRQHDYSPAREAPWDV
jgi:pyruvate dehydrogenase E1 component